MQKVNPSDQESQKLAAKAQQNESLQKFVVWRRSALLVASPSVFVSMILAFVNLEGLFSPDSARNRFGQAIWLITSCADMFLLIAMMYSYFTWHQVVRSTRGLRIGWALATIAPFLPAVFPLEIIARQDFLDLLTNAEITFAKFVWALAYVIELLPVVVTLPGSAVRASLRVRNLLPHSSIPGWILIICAPFYSLIVLVALVVITQVAGDVLLLVGTFLVVAKPWLYMVRGGLFVGPSTPEVEGQISILLWIGLAVGIVGNVLVLSWALTANVSGVRPLGQPSGPDDETIYLLSFRQFFQILFETIGRVMVSTVVFSDMIVGIVLQNYKDEMLKEEIVGSLERHRDFEAFEQALPVKDRRGTYNLNKNGGDDRAKRSHLADPPHKKNAGDYRNNDDDSESESV